MNKLHRWFAIGVLLGALLAVSLARATELPLPATPIELMEQAAYFDERPVYVEGKITYAALFTGRLDGEYEVVMLTDEQDRSIRIFLTGKEKFQVGEHVGIQGVFHKEAYFAGYPWENFIVFKSVYRDRR